MNVARVIEPEEDEGNGPIVTIRDNMIALAILVILATSYILVTSHYHPWQLSIARQPAQLTRTQTMVGCCAAVRPGAQPTSGKLTPCRCPDPRSGRALP